MNDDELSKLRKELNKICEMLDDMQIRSQLKQLKDKGLDHTVNLKEPSEKLEKEFTCFEYALGLNNSQEYIRKRKMLKEAGFGCVCDSYFVQWLVTKDYIKKDYIKKDSKEIVLYYKSGISGPQMLKHAGIVGKSQIIISKWGQGNVYEHDLFHIPEEYGNSPYYFKKPEKNEIEKYFNEYLKELASTINSFYNSPERGHSATIFPNDKENSREIIA